jgi:hypothetical protein
MQNSFDSSKVLLLGVWNSALVPALCSSRGVSSLWNCTVQYVAWSACLRPLCSYWVPVYSDKFSPAFLMLLVCFKHAIRVVFSQPGYIYTNSMQRPRSPSAAPLTISASGLAVSVLKRAIRRTLGTWAIRLVEECRIQPSWLYKFSLASPPLLLPVPASSPLVPAPLMGVEVLPRS